MKPLLSATLGTLAYAGANVLIESKLSKYNNLTIIICYSGFVCVAAMIGRMIVRTSDPSFNFPTGSGAIAILALCLLYLIGDYFYIGAYTGGASLALMVCISVLFPVFATIIKYMQTGGLPNRWQFAGYTLAVLAVVVVTKGNTPAK